MTNIPISSQAMAVRVLLDRDACTKLCGRRSSEADRLKQFLEAALDTLLWLDANKEMVKRIRNEQGGQG